MSALFSHHELVPLTRAQDAAVANIPSAASNTTTGWSGGLKRDDWMLPPEERAEKDSTGGEYDFFSSLGKAKEASARLQGKAKAAADSAAGKLHITDREINMQFKEGKSLEEYDAPAPRAEDVAFGGPGYKWRMVKLRRVFERAQEEGRPVEDVALDQYNGLAAFEQAKAEQRWLDGEKTARPSAPQQDVTRGDAPTAGIMVHDVSSSRASTPTSGFQRPGLFRKPGSSSILRSRTSTPQSPAPGSLVPEKPVPQGSIERSLAARPPQSATPIPSVFAPVAPGRAGPSAPQGVKVPRLSPTELSKLRAQAMKAEMTNQPNAPQLRQKYDQACYASESGAQEGGDKGDGFFSLNREGHMLEINEDTEHPDEEVELRVLPTLDSHGRLYDVGPPNAQTDEQFAPGNRRKKVKDVSAPQKLTFGRNADALIQLLPVRDPKTGEVVAYNAKEDTETLADLVRAERFQGGPDQGADAMLAQSITRDAGFRANAEYMDDNVDRLAVRRDKNALSKRNFAIQDFARVKKALDECPFCIGQADAGPSNRREVTDPISSGTRTYLTLPLRESLAPIHALVVPIDHTLSLLEIDDDAWDEIKVRNSSQPCPDSDQWLTLRQNFMKCLIQLAHTRKEKMVFYETVVNLRWHKHTYLECVGLPQDLADDLPAYFREELMQTGDEWSQHRKIIPFTADRPMRRSLVPNLPYFAVLFDYRGTSGIGHVIEAPDIDRDMDNNSEEQKDGIMGLERAAFPRNFAAQLLGTLLDREPRVWRRPRRLDNKAHKARQAQFTNLWSPYDWTKMLESA